MGKLPLTASLLLCLTFAANAQAPAAATKPVPDKPKPDVLVLTNGDQLTGQMERAVGSSVVFKSDNLGELTIPLDKVKELRSNTEFVGLTKDLKKHKAVGYVEVAGPNVELVRPADAGVEVSIPKKDVGYLIDRDSFNKEVAHHASPWQGWNGTVTAGLTLVRSTDNSTTVNAGISLARTIPTVPYLPKRNRTTVNISESYGELTTAADPDTATPFSLAKTNIFHADSERDEYFSARFFALGDVSFDHNYSQGLQLQEIYGAGAGWTPIQTPRQQLDLKGDVHYEKQTFQTPSSNLNIIGSTFTEVYRRNLPRKVAFTETGNYLPAWNELYAYSANISGALTLPLFKRLAVSLSATDNYLNNPAPYFLKNSFQFVTGVTYTLH